MQSVGKMTIFVILRRVVFIGTIVLYKVKDRINYYYTRQLQYFKLISIKYNI
jgi:hypothetical protein